MSTTPTRKRVHWRWWGRKPNKRRCPRCKVYNSSGYVCECVHDNINYQLIDKRRKRDNRRGFHELRILRVNRRLQRAGLPFKLEAERRQKYRTEREPTVNLRNTDTGAIVAHGIDVVYWADGGTKTPKPNEKRHPYEVWLEKKQRRERGEPEPSKPIPPVIEWLRAGAQGDPPTSSTAD